MNEVTVPPSDPVAVFPETLRHVPVVPAAYLSSVGSPTGFPNDHPLGILGQQPVLETRPTHPEVY